MQVFCKPSDSSPDVHCPVCGQGFLLYWERSCRIQQEDTRHRLQQWPFAIITLTHTDTGKGIPETAFNIPNWSGLPQFSAAATPRRSSSPSGTSCQFSVFQAALEADNGEPTTSLPSR